MIQAYAAQSPQEKLTPFTYDPGPLQPQEVEIKVEYCGICHSDLSMWKNDWQITTYPFVPGHEIVGTVVEMGEGVTTLKIGQKVGLGWFAHSCLYCEWCMAGDHNLCPNIEQTIVGRYGGFGERVRAHQEWLIPLLPDLDPVQVGPLFCGGITVFNPIVQFEVKPTSRVGVIGIGGLGHLALQFLDAWGCEVIAFSSNPAKEAEAKQMGADYVINSRDAQALKSVSNSLDFIISTVNVNLDWSAYISALRPKGRLHFVGVVPDAINLFAFPLLMGQKSVSGSPLGSPKTIGEMLTFCERHGIAPVTEMFPMSRVNEAFDHLQSGKARYRIVLQADF